MRNYKIDIDSARRALEKMDDRDHRPHNPILTWDSETGKVDLTSDLIPLNDTEIIISNHAYCCADIAGEDYAPEWSDRDILELIRYQIEFYLDED